MWYQLQAAARSMSLLLLGSEPCKYRTRLLLPKAAADMANDDGSAFSPPEVPFTVSMDAP